MPVKRRLAKGRKQLGDMEIEDLMYGPGACLINGEGYLGPHGDGIFQEKSEVVQAQILEAMRADWERHSDLVRGAWAARTPHDLWCARNHYGNPSEPWAAEQFGEPK